MQQVEVDERRGRRGRANREGTSVVLNKGSRLALASVECKRWTIEPNGFRVRDSRVLTGTSLEAGRGARDNPRSWDER